MKLFILGLILIAVVTFFAYRKKIQENMFTIWFCTLHKFYAPSAIISAYP